jgi:acetolactate synthase-1/2/3 large subunit
MDGVKHLVLIEAQSPCAFFAYPGRESSFVPEGCSVHTLADFGVDGPDALARISAAFPETPV